MKKDIKKQIKDVVKDLVKIKDYDSITIREICKESKIGLGSFYNHFKDKDDIILSAIIDGVDYTDKEIRTLLTANTGYENLKIYLEQQCYLYKKVEIKWLKEIFKSYLYRKTDFILDRSGVNYQLIQSIVKEGQADNTIRKDIATDTLAWIILKLIIGNGFSYCMEEGNFDLEKATIDEVLIVAQANF